ncbi:MAG TPA: hypothetical protein IAB25_02150 [Candidatus Coproplasma stercoravium]|nr:hypothetical protein [Candidatus Coproplasma stercoravium]
MKLYDFDGMFDKRLSEYISKNVGKYKEEEWEDMIPEMYAKFGNTVLKSLGTSPNGYYAAMSPEELVKCLRAHVKNGVPVSEFLCKAIEARPGCEGMLLPLLENGEEGLKQYVVNILGSSPAAIPVYMRMIEREEDEDFKNQCVDFIKENADLVKEQALENYKNGVEKPLMLEILSKVKERDGRVYDILLAEFLSGEDVPMHAGYLASYGDERALPYLLEKIDEEGISYIEYQELKYAIEALGGEYTKQRDFSGDEYYDLIHSHSVSSADIFSVFEEGAEGSGKAN